MVDSKENYKFDVGGKRVNSTNLSCKQLSSSQKRHTCKLANNKPSQAYYTTLCLWLFPTTESWYSLIPFTYTFNLLANETWNPSQFGIYFWSFEKSISSIALTCAVKWSIVRIPQKKCLAPLAYTLITVLLGKEKIC